MKDMAQKQLSDNFNKKLKKQAKIIKYCIFKVTMREKIKKTKLYV